MLVEVVPRVGASKNFSPSVFGYSYTYCIVSDEGRLRVFVDTPVSVETLSTLFGVRKASLDEVLSIFGNVYASEARLRRSFDFWYTDFGIADLPGLVNQLAASGARGGICVAVSRDPSLQSLMLSRASKLMQKATKYNNQAYRVQAKEIAKRAQMLYVGKVVVLSDSKSGRKLIERLVESASTCPIRWIKDRASKAGELEKLLKPNRIPLLNRLLGIAKDYPILSEETVKKTIVLPDPSLHKVGFVRGYPLPVLAPARTGEKSFRVGALEDGREFRLDIEDLYRHVYIIGQTGSGKTSFIKLLVHRLAELGEAAIVVDPHGDMARELAEEMPSSVYLHPIKSPFGLNPLDLPRTEDRGHSITIAIDILLEMFKEVLKLMETAVNVKYLLQVILRTLYTKTDSPTMADLYNVILALYRGELDLDVDDPEWQQQLEALQSMQDQTFISALSRLEPYAHDRLLMKLTSRTTIDMERVLSPGSVTIFAIPKAYLGENIARLIASTIVMKIWFEVLARARMGKPRTPVFLVIDEFQFVSDLPIIDTILSEARKYGLHLVIAHQHTKQIPDTLLQSIMSNCAVKIAFQVGGADIKRLSLMDASFADSLAKALTGLTIGKAVVKVTARPGEQQPPPVVVQFDYIPHRVVREDIYTSAFDPGEMVKADLKSMVNPILRYIDPVKPLELYSLYYMFRYKRIHIADLAARLGAPKKDIEDAVNRLASLGYVEVVREGNRKVLVYVKGLFRGLKRATPSEEGYAIARKALLKYFAKGFVAVPARQSPDLRARPDLVAIPIDRSMWRPLYSKAVAVEIESCNELEVHPEQVVRNWVKESVRDFAEIHTWTARQCFDKLEELYEEHPEAHDRVRIFYVEPRPGKEGGKIVEQATEVAEGVEEAVEMSGGKVAGADTGVDERVKLIEVDGRGYRVVFRSSGDAEKFSSLVSGGYRPVVSGSKVCVTRGSYQHCFDIERIEAL